MLDAVSLAVGYVAGVLTPFALSWGVGRLTTDAAQTAAQAASADTLWTCTCGQRFAARQEAKDHARETHNAPVQDDGWLHIMEPPGQPDA